MNGRLVYRPFEILIVEDNAGDVLLMQQAFHETMTAVHLNFVTNGEEAINFLKREGKYKESPAPDMVLLDLNTPRIDGRMALRMIKSDPAFKIIPVIILTSSRLESDVREAYEMNANGYLMKPMDFRGFQETTRCLVDFWFKRAVLPSRLESP